MYEKIVDRKNMVIVMNVYSADLARIVAIGKQNGIRFSIRNNAEIGKTFLGVAAWGDEESIPEFVQDVWNEIGYLQITKEIAA